MTRYAREAESPPWYHGKEGDMKAASKTGKRTWVNDEGMCPCGIKSYKNNRKL